MSDVLRVAVLDGVMVTNVVMSSAELADEWYGPGNWVDITEVFCGVGFTYNPVDGTFTPPPDPPPEE